MVPVTGENYSTRRFAGPLGTRGVAFPLEVDADHDERKKGHARAGSGLGPDELGEDRPHRQIVAGTPQAVHPTRTDATDTQLFDAPRPRTIFIRRGRSRAHRSHTWRSRTAADVRGTHTHDRASARPASR